MMGTKELVKRVRRLVNETENDMALSLVSSALPSLDDNIVALLPQAVSMVQKHKKRVGEPVNVKNMSSAIINVADNGDGGGCIPLPDDFVGPVAVQLEGWNRVVTTVHDDASPEALRQKSEYTRAGCCKPVCVESVNAAGERVLLLYPLPSGEVKMKLFSYEAAFSPEGGELRCSASMADAVVYMCAALLYNMFERYDAANVFMSMAVALCNDKIVERR